MDERIEKVKEIQRIIGATDDGIWGPKSSAALELFVHPPLVFHVGLASSFADPGDVKSFRKCKAEGGYWQKGAWKPGSSDDHCFEVGDNGKGCWLDDTSEGSGPSCAIPPEDMVAHWGSVDAARLKKIEVTIGGRTAIVLVKDRMPHKENITNGAVIDLNPDAVRLLGLEPPMMEHCSWRPV